jgi:micrococcal nuclease
MKSRMKAERFPSFRAAVALILLVPGPLSALPARTRKAPAPSETAIVVVVYDGDTVKVRFGDGNERRVRLIGIDTPELDDKRENVRFMACVAKRFAFLKLYRKQVRLDYDWQSEDKYGRLLAFLTTEDGVLFNELILREGFAFKLRAFPFKPELMKRFEAAENQARSGEQGLWRRREPPIVAPAEAAGLLGQLASVRMICASVEERKPFIVLHSPGGEFEAIVPERRRADFPGLEAMAGKPVLVKGLVEEFRRRVQIVVDLPMQIRILPSPRIVDPFADVAPRPSRRGQEARLRVNPVQTLAPALPGPGLGSPARAFLSGSQGVDRAARPGIQALRSAP